MRSEPDGAPRRLRNRFIAAALILTVAAGGAFALARSQTSRIERALTITRDASNFQTASDASVSFAIVGDLLFDEGRQCARRRPASELGRCSHIIEASADPQLAAFRSLRCSPADVEALRVAIEENLDALSRRLRGQSVPTPARQLPRCG